MSEYVQCKYEYSVCEFVSEYVEFYVCISSVCVCEHMFESVKCDYVLSLCV